jgi:Organic solute transporter Ostalpha
VLQFLSVKVFIVLQVWLGFIVRAFVSQSMIGPNDPYDLDQFTYFLQSFLVCIEMIFAAVLHLWAFDYSIFVRDVHTSIWPGVVDCFKYLDLYNDFIFVLRFVFLRMQNVSLVSRDGSNYSSQLLSEGDINDAESLLRTESANA